jgi:chlorinating enzyme
MSQTESSLAPLPSPEEVLFYQEHGYLKYGQIFRTAELDALRGWVDRKIAGLPPGRRPEGMDVPHFDDPWLFRYLAHPRVLDVIERFIGPDIVLWSSHFIAKPGEDGRAVPWHTDGAYWGAVLQPMQVVTLWLAVDASTRDNGCMRVIAGSHRGDRAARDAYEAVDQEQHVFHARLPAGLVDESRAVDLELAPGECHFHDAWTVHSSDPNRSGRRRCGYTMRYMPAHVVFQPGEWRHRPHRVYLFRGQDRTGGRTSYTPVPEQAHLPRHRRAAARPG